MKIRSLYDAYMRDDDPIYTAHTIEQRTSLCVGDRFRGDAVLLSLLATNGWHGPLGCVFPSRTIVSRVDSRTIVSRVDSERGIITFSSGWFPVSPRPPGR